MPDRAVGRPLVETLELRRLLSAVHHSDHLAHPHSVHSHLVGPHIAAQKKGAKDGGASKPHGNGHAHSGDGTNSDSSGGSSDGQGNENGGASTSGSSDSNPTATLVDSLPPVSTLSAPDVTGVVSGDEQVTAVFTDNGPLSVSSISGNVLAVTGPVPLSVSAATLSQGGDKSVTAVFGIHPQSGGWSAADNGTYSLSLSRGAIVDAAGNSSLGSIASFEINLPQPAGSVDAGFGAPSSAAVTAPFIAEAVAVQPDGKLLVAGHQGDRSTGQSQGVIERINSDGSVDSSFGSHGQVITASGNNDAFFAIGLEPDGHIVVAGSSSISASESQFLAQRFDTDGRLDGAFGNQGRALSGFGGTTAVANSLALTSDGNIVLGGESDGRFAFAELDAAGQLQSDFGQGGRQLFSLSNGLDTVGALAITGDGHILAAGASGTNVVLLRLSSVGAADTSFGHGGSVTMPDLQVGSQMGAVNHAEGLAIDGSGRILVASETAAGHFGLVRLSSTGILDTQFGNNGLVTSAFGSADHADQIVLDPSGQILVVGTSTTSGATSTAVAAFDQNGNVETGFGTSGQVLIAPNAGSVTRELHVGDLVLHAFGALQDGKLVIASSAPTTTVAPASTLRRILITPQTSTLPSTSQPLGVSGGKIQKALFTLSDGTKATFMLRVGTGTATAIGDRIRLQIQSQGKGAVLAVQVTGGSGRVVLDNVTIEGSLASFRSSAAELAGTLYASESIGTLSLGQISGVVACGAGAISVLTATSVIGAHILSGANLGADGLLGGTGANSDTFTTGTIGAIKVSGAISASIFGAGLDPVDGVFLNGNDRLHGGKASVIHSVTARGVDASTRFVAGAFGWARLPQRVTVTSDPHFVIMS